MPALQIAILVIAAVGALLFWRGRTVTIVYPPTVGLLYRDGRFERELPPGRYVRFDPFGRTIVVKVSLADLPAPFGEITVLSKDQFSFRLALAPILKIVDARLFVESQPAAGQSHALSQFMTVGAGHPALHSETAAAAREVVATKNLTEILADQPTVADAVQARLEQSIPGATVERVLLTAITLPPETRRMFTDVERARMEAQATLERARGEQAALRVLANAARLLADNPALANLRLLQAIEITKGSTTIVLGSPSAAAGPFGFQSDAPGSA